MKRKVGILLGSITVLILASTAVSVKAAAARRMLKVKLNYTGSGTVNNQHKIYVLLFDANPYTAPRLVDSTSSVTPPAAVAGVSHILRRESASRKNDTVTFNGLSVSPVYAVAFFDKSGSYDGHSDPAPGTPMGVYGSAPDKAMPITLQEGKTARVVLTFNDSVKTP